MHIGRTYGADIGGPHPFEQSGVVSLSNARGCVASTLADEYDVVYRNINYPVLRVNDIWDHINIQGVSAKADQTEVF